MARKRRSATATAGQELSLSDDGVRLIAGFEGFRSDLYNDPAGHCTIGYGHLVHLGNCDGSEPADLRKGISRKRARELLRDDAASAEAAVNDAVKVPLSQEQFDALVSFVFNVGTGAFRRSTLLRLLNDGGYDDVPKQLDRWVKAGGKTLEGLVRRRKRGGRALRLRDGRAVQTLEAVEAEGGSGAHRGRRDRRRDGPPRPRADVPADRGRRRQGAPARAQRHREAVRPDRRLHAGRGREAGREDAPGHDRGRPRHGPRRLTAARHREAARDRPVGPAAAARPAHPDRRADGAGQGATRCAPQEARRGGPARRRSRGHERRQPALGRVERRHGGVRGAVPRQARPAARLGQADAGGEQARGWLPDVRPPDHAHDDRCPGLPHLLGRGRRARAREVDGVQVVAAGQLRRASRSRRAGTASACRSSGAPGSSTATTCTWGSPPADPVAAGAASGAPASESERDSARPNLVRWRGSSRR